MFIVGIDIGKRKHKATIMDQWGVERGKTISFDNTADGFQRLLEWGHKAAGDEKIIFGMEATGHYWVPLYSYLSQSGYTIHVINAIQSDALRGMYIRDTKNDKQDSFIVAEVIRFGRFCESKMPDPVLYNMRMLCRQRSWMVADVADLKRKIASLRDQIFPEYDTLFKNSNGKTSLQLLYDFTTPEAFCAVDRDELVDIIHIASRGHMGLKKAQEIQEAASRSVGSKLGADAITFLIRRYVEQIWLIDAQIKEIEKEIDQMMSGCDNQLQTITGIGPTIAATITSEIGDIRHFASSHKLAAYAGLDATVRQSGEHIVTCSYMSKRGSRYLRSAICQAAQIAAFRDPALSVYYQRKRNAGKSHRSALGHVARKMVNIIFAVLRDNKPYSPAV